MQKIKGVHEAKIDMNKIMSAQIMAHLNCSEAVGHWALILILTGNWSPI